MPFVSTLVATSETSSLLTGIVEVVINVDVVSARAVVGLVKLSYFFQNLY